eukprot:5151555-Prymnesium_polylepis.1
MMWVKDTGYAYVYGGGSQTTGWGNQFSFGAAWPLVWTNHAPYDIDPAGWGSYQSQCHAPTDGAFHHYAVTWSGSGNTA